MASNYGRARNTVAKAQAKRTTKFPSLGDIANGLRSGKEMVKTNTKIAKAKVYKTASPALRMAASRIEKGVSPKKARKAPYGK